MPLEIPLQIHFVRTTYPDPEIDFWEIAALYQTAGIKLAIEIGESIGDPERGQVVTYSTLLDRWRPSGVGRLIVGTHLEGHPHVNGRLVDLTSRGIATVYRSAADVQSMEGMLEVCAHEIGHMFNLEHRHSSTDYVSTMRQSPRRSVQTAADAWSRAMQDPDSYSDAFLFPPEKTLSVYPLSYNARRWLNTGDQSEILPWGGTFNDAEHAD